MIGKKPSLEKNNPQKNAPKEAEKKDYVPNFDKAIKIAKDLGGKLAPKDK